jgi:hypothetical protein
MTTIPGSADEFEFGEIVRDFTDITSGLRGIVMRGGMSWCGYVGAPNEHPLNGVEELRFKCHYGVNFSCQGEDSVGLPHGYYWWGWDYAHCTDMVVLPPELKPFARHLEHLHFGRSLKVWTADEVAEDVLDAMMSLRESVEQNLELARMVLKRAMPFSGAG